MSGETIKNIRKSLEKIEKEASKKRKDLGFNLFNVLNVQDEELKHSRFIAELLNPSASHGQGDVFFKIFLGIVFPKKEIKTINKVKIILEKHFNSTEKYSEGFIDILIRFTENEIRKCIIIENKIHAGDQSEQLLKYYNAAQIGRLYGENGKTIKHEYKPEDMEILYLTLDGHKPSKQSCGNELFTENIKNTESGKKIFCISYEDHILKWTKECIKVVENNKRLDDTLNQYSDILYKLISDYKKKMEIIKLFDENSNYKFLSDISKEESIAGDLIRMKWHFIQCHIEFLFWEELETQIENYGWHISDKQKFSWSKIINSKSSTQYGVTFNISDSCEVHIQNDFDLPKYSINNTEFKYFENSVFFLKSKGNHKAQVTAEKRLQKKLKKLEHDKQNCKMIINNTHHELLNSANRKEFVGKYLEEIKRILSSQI